MWRVVTALLTSGERSINRSSNACRVWMIRSRTSRRTWLSCSFTGAFSGLRPPLPEVVQRLVEIV